MLPDETLFDAAPEVKLAAPTFVPIAGFEGFYAAGSDGRIYRVDKETPRALRGTPNSKGYETVTLSAAGKHSTVYVHVVICVSFKGPPPFEGAEANHIDTCKRNNVPDNLEWVTSSGNKKHAVAHGVMIPPGSPGERNHNAKLTNAQVEEIRSMAGIVGYRRLGRRFGVTRQAIQKIIKGKNWKQ